MSQQLLFHFTTPKVSLTVSEYVGHQNERNPQKTLCDVIFQAQLYSPVLKSKS